MSKHMAAESVVCLLVFLNMQSCFFPLTSFFASLRTTIDFPLPVLSNCRGSVSGEHAHSARTHVLKYVTHLLLSLVLW